MQKIRFVITPLRRALLQTSVVDAHHALVFVCMGDFCGCMTSFDCFLAVNYAGEASRPNCIGGLHSAASLRRLPPTGLCIRRPCVLYRPDGFMAAFLQALLR
jgi:hypothetical protein